jgi:hypothetical protein
MTNFSRVLRTSLVTVSSPPQKGALMKAFPRALGMLALVALACDKRDVSVSHVATTDETYAVTSSWATFDQGPSAKIDVLFMVDNSPSMASLQAKLVTSFSEFMKVLQALPGGVPDLHIGVVSSDLGAGAFTTNEVAGCQYGGDQGKLQVAPHVGTTEVSLSDHWIALHVEPTSGTLVTNYGQQKLEDVFTSIALLGETGCGFEHPFGSVMRALGADGHGGPPPENKGFLREDAYLAVILLSNEDDCSAPLDSRFFDPASKKIGDPLGPLTSFRCNAFGHLCKRGGDAVAPSMTVATSYEQCDSNEDGPLVKVSDFVSSLKHLKGDPARVFVAAIAGPPLPYSVALKPADGVDDPHPWPFVQHSCTQPLPPAGDGSYGDPAIRLWAAVQGFGGHGVFESICNNSVTPALEAIARGLSQPLLPPCVSVPTGSPGCAVFDRWTGADGRLQAARLSSCADVGGAPPCWTLATDELVCPPGQQRLDVDRGGATPPAHLFTAVDCTTAP